MSCATFPAEMPTANPPSCFSILTMAGAFWLQSGRVAYSLRRPEGHAVSHRRRRISQEE